jgi:hypothetical protein
VLNARKSQELMLIKKAKKYTGVSSAILVLEKQKILRLVV